MSMVLAALTIDTLRQITPGSPRVPSYDVINNSVAYQYDPARAEYAPKIGGEELIFGHKYSPRPRISSVRASSSSTGSGPNSRRASRIAGPGRGATVPGGCRTGACSGCRPRGGA